MGRPASEVRSASPERLARVAWFVQPAPVIAVATTVAVLLWILTPSADFAQLTRTFKVRSTAGPLYYWLSAVAVVVGAFLSAVALPLPRGWRPYPSSRSMLRTAAIAAFALAALGYAVWFALAVVRAGGPEALLRFLAGSLLTTPTYEIKAKYFTTFPGVTTLTQVGIPAGALLVLWRETLETRRRWLPTGMVAILALGAFFRAMLLSERLALIEFVLPVLVVIALRHRTFFRRNQIAIPVVGTVLVYLLFTAAESLRSWLFYKNQGYDSLYLFTLFRLGSYYTTSVNNAAYLVEHGYGALSPGFFSALGFWSFPVFSTYLFDYTALTGIAPQARLGEALAGGVLSAEFNVFSTPGYLFVDYGWFALVYFLALGALVQQVYLRGERGDWLWMVFYATLFTGILEFPRIIYLTIGRIVPALMFVAVIGLIRWVRSPARAGVA